MSPVASPLAVVRLLRAHPTAAAGLRALQAQLRVVARFHAEEAGLVQLRYAPGASPADHPIVRECRGLILDASANWAPVAFPFLRFFNDAPGAPTPIDWESARVYDKLDGSMVVLYHHRGRWRVASSRRPDGSGVLGAFSDGGPVGFADHFWQTWRAEGYTLPDTPRWIYVFELSSRIHPIVVQHERDSLRLLGARDMATLAESFPEPVAAARGWRSVAQRSLWPDGAPARARLAAVRAHVAGLDGRTAEGVVVCDGRFERLKFKSPGYLARHWRFPLRGTGRRLARRKYLEVICAHEVDEFLAVCPLQAPFVAAVRRELDALVSAIDAESAVLAGLSDPRAFAAAAGGRAHSTVLFARRKRPAQTTLSLLLRNRPERIERMLDAQPGGAS